ncbi:MAG: peptide chain release factor 2 [Rickettsiales bacterium]
MKNIDNLFEINQIVDQLLSSLDLIRRSVDKESTKVEIIQIEESLINKYQDISSETIKLLKRKTFLENKILKLQILEDKFNSAIELLNLAKFESDNELVQEIYQELINLQTDIAQLEIESLLKEEKDDSNAFIEINAGAGGTESHDWASMLMRMYLRFCENMKFKTEILDIINDDEAGIKSCVIKVSGLNAYGWLKTEAGVHRLVRISPFNANAKRMTSFASVFVYPEIENDINIIIDEKDLRIDTYRASGAGGQHINKTDSAVRITHLPTNIVVSSQVDRSQHKNKAECLKVLKAKLYKLEEQKQKENINSIVASKVDASWGNQIRSYVLQPYQMVKDLRTNYESGNVKAILDGEIINFIKKSLSSNL